MTLTGRDTLFERPEIFGGEDEEDEEDTQAEDDTVEVFGSGGGPTIHGIEFEPGDYEVVAGANTTAVLATGEDGGELFEHAFMNAAAQLKELQQNNDNIRDVARFGIERGVADLGLTESQIEILNQEPEDDTGDVTVSTTDSSEESQTSETDEEVVEDTGGEDEIEDLEDEIEDVKDEGGSGDGEQTA